MFFHFSPFSFVEHFSLGFTICRSVEAEECSQVIAGSKLWNGEPVSGGTKMQEAFAFDREKAS